LFKRNHKLNKIPEVAIFAVFTLLFTAPFYIFGRYSYGQTATFSWIFSYYQNSLGSLWNPYPLGGMDLRSQASFHIWEVLGPFLPAWLLGAVFLWLLIYFPSAFFMYRLLRLRFGVGQVGAYTGALFMLFSYSKGGAHTIAWTLVPVILESIFWIDKERRRYISYVIAGGLGVLYASTSAFYDQVFALFFVFLFILIYQRNILWRISLHIPVFIFCWVLLHVPSLLALHEIVPYAARSSRELNFNWEYFIVIEGTGSYRPYAQVALLLCALIITRLRNPSARTAFFYLLVFGLFYNGLSFVVYIFSNSWSLINTIGLGRMLLWTSFLFSFSAGLAVDAISSSWSTPFIKRVCMIATIAFGLWVLYNHVLDRGYEWKNYGSYAYHNDAVIFETLAKKAVQSPPFRISTLETTGQEIVNSNLIAHEYETFSGPNLLSSMRFVRYWDAMTRCETRDDIECMKLSDRPEYFYIKLPHSLDGKGADISGISTSMLSLANVRYVLSKYPIVNDNKIVEIHHPGKPSLEEGKTLWEIVKINFSGRDDLYLYEFKDVLPRVYLARNVRVFDNDTELLSALSETKINEVRDSVFLSRTDGPVKSLTSNDAPGQASFIKLNNDEFEVDVNVEGPAYLFISNSFNEGWQCTNQDGKMLQMRPAFHFFTAIMVDEEDRTITCHYSPFASLKL